jgi:effector-binding domain-containing protein
MADVSVAMASTSKKAGSKEVLKGDTYAGKVAMVSYMGPFEGTGEVHYFMHDQILNDGYDFAGSPWEVYVTDMTVEPDTSKWITQIYYPVMKKEAM